MKQALKFIVGSLMAAVLGLSASPAWGQETLDTYLDKYWGETRSVKVIQKRLFQKDGRFALTPYFGTIPNDDFAIYFPLGVKASYFFSEDLAVEAFGSYMPRMDSELGTFLSEDLNVLPEYPQLLKWNAGIQGLWSPIHGKVALFDWKLFHFDVYTVFGVGAIGTDVADKADTIKKSRTDVAGHVGAGMKMYVTNWGAISLDYRHFFFAAMERLGGVSTPVELTLGFSWFIN